MPSGPVILDCTIRDGSYAIDFKFTAEDTALIAGLLDEAGLRYIEIGHGLGLGASEAGKGAAASSDLEVIERTRPRVTSARIGAFFIPGVGSKDNLRAAADAGLDFVRVGNNADEMETAWPFIEAARGLGLEVFLNLMKTYGVQPTAMADAAEQAASLGAAGIYVVDSAGGMLPGEVAEYVSTTLERVELPVGFHGHSNLHLAVANSLAAIDAGATFVDTSVYGIGRSSGNVPTEVMAAVLDRMGIPSGVDALQIIDIAETYLRPLAEHLHPHDMIAVSLGYGRFHSSYLPRALAAAREAGINPFRLIVELGRRDMMRLPNELLDDAVAKLSERAPAPEVRLDVARFSDARFGPRRIGNRPTALSELLDGLGVVAAKRRLSTVLDLVESTALDEEDVSAEFVLEDDFMALGRLRFGSLEALLQAIEQAGVAPELALLDTEGSSGTAVSQAVRSLSPALGCAVVPYSSSELELEYLGDAVQAAIAVSAAGRVTLQDPGIYPSAEVERLAARLGVIAAVERAAPQAVAPPADLQVTAGPPGESQEGQSGPAIFLTSAPWLEEEELPPGWVVLDRRDAYRDRLPRWRRAAAGVEAIAGIQRVR